MSFEMKYDANLRTVPIEKQNESTYHYRSYHDVNEAGHIELLNKHFQRLYDLFEGNFELLVKWLWTQNMSFNQREQFLRAVEYILSNNVIEQKLDRNELDLFVDDLIFKYQERNKKKE